MTFAGMSDRHQVCGEAWEKKNVDLLVLGSLSV